MLRSASRIPRRSLAAAGVIGLAVLAGCSSNPGATGAGPTTQVPLIAPPGPAITVAPAVEGFIAQAARATVAAGTARFAVQELLGPRARPIVALRADGQVGFDGPRGIRRDRAHDAVFGGTGRPVGRLVDIATVWVDGNVSIEQPVDNGKPGRPTSGSEATLGELLSLRSRVAGRPEAALAAEFEGWVFGRVGREEVRGREATRYRAEHPGEDIEALDLWVDRVGRIVRLATSSVQPRPNGAPFVSTLELYDFGAPLDIPTPPATGK